jgi:subtilase family serine protease
MSCRRSRRRYFHFLAVVVTVAALSVVLAPTGPAAAATSGSKTPAIGVRPHYHVAGHVGPTVPPTFTCQVTTPAQCYGPAQIRAAYGVDTLAGRGLDGHGRSITIIDAFQSPTIQHDLDLFNRVFELPALTVNIVAPDGLTPFDQNDANQVGWAGEITLDVEWAHAIAPGAAINLVLAKSNDDADINSAIKYVVDHNLGDVISQSFGEAEQCMAPNLLAQAHALYDRARGQHQTVFASSGDQGAAQPTCDGSSFFKAASTPASEPSVTGVGGTILDADGLSGAYHSETTWNEPEFEAAGGGGFSTVYREPLYQVLAQHSGRRGVPDIAYNAGINSGVLTVWSTSGQGANLLFIFGGTSAGSPQWAGLIALADQAAHKRVGFINDQLYGLAASRPVYTTLYHDITTGDNTFHGAAFGDVDVQGFAATPGWDPATGIGTPKAQKLVPALALTGVVG